MTLPPHGTLKTEFLLNNIKTQFIPHRKHSSSRNTKTNRLMFFREIDPVCCENHMKEENIFWGQDAEFFYII
jgi:hypothetical protein